MRIRNPFKRFETCAGATNASRSDAFPYSNYQICRSGREQNATRIIQRFHRKIRCITNAYKRDPLFDAYAHLLRDCMESELDFEWLFFVRRRQERVLWRIFHCYVCLLPLYFIDVPMLIFWGDFAGYLMEFSTIGYYEIKFTLFRLSICLAYLSGGLKI